jgi:MoxR-like ATPase
MLTYGSGLLGVGKTLTVEAVSERLKRPVYLVRFSVLYPAKLSLID